MNILKYAILISFILYSCFYDKLYINYWYGQENKPNVFSLFVNNKYDLKVNNFIIKSTSIGNLDSLYYEDSLFYKSINIVLVKMLFKNLHNEKFYEIKRKLLVNCILMDSRKILPYYELLLHYMQVEDIENFYSLKKITLEKFKNTKYPSQIFILNQINYLELDTIPNSINSF
jgi:hypothetical protein